MSGDLCREVWIETTRVHSFGGALSESSHRLPRLWSAGKLFQLLAVKMAVPLREPNWRCTSQSLQLFSSTSLRFPSPFASIHVVPLFTHPLLSAHSLLSLLPSSAQFQLSSFKPLLVLVLLHLLLYSKSPPTASSFLRPSFDTPHSLLLPPSSLTKPPVKTTSFTQCPEKNSPLKALSDMQDSVKSENSCEDGRGERAGARGRRGKTAKNIQNRAIEDKSWDSVRIVICKTEEATEVGKSSEVGAEWLTIR